MKAVLLDGGWGGGAVEAIAAETHETLERAGWTSEWLRIRDLGVAACNGCFGCWIRTPGECLIADDARRVARAVATSDLVVYLTPVTFGGYSSLLKRALDREICLISPFFEQIGEEIHHRARYDRYPAILALGVMPRRAVGRAAGVSGSDDAPASEQLFAKLVERNAINLHAPRHAAVVLDPDGEWQSGVAAALASVGVESLSGGSRPPAPAPPPSTPAAEVPALKTGDAGRALLLYGSPRASRSTSETLGGYLVERLRQRGVACESMRLHAAVKSAEGRAELAAAVERCGTVVLVAPLYVDSLPAPVIRGLELVAERSGAGQGRRFAAIMNCGFPEAKHCATALEICRRFAFEAGFEWSGGLALGAGGALDGKSLQGAGSMARTVRDALQLAGDALADNRSIPAEPVELMATPMMPSWVYVRAVSVSFRMSAWRNGVKHLGVQPYRREA